LINKVALSLNHFSVRTLDLEATRDFYERVLRLTVGPRPDFPFPGLWMYRGDHSDTANAVVHVIGIDRNDPEGLKKYLGDRDVSTLHGSGAVDHVAFFATGLAGMLAHLRAQGVPVRERTVPTLGLHQLFLDDPNGVVIELNYPAAERAADGS
jgi:catechol 2,3-dioxygenase-like lactoylglutathione lyase family enzyme